MRCFEHSFKAPHLIKYLLLLAQSPKEIAYLLFFATIQFFAFTNASIHGLTSSRRPAG